MCRTGGDTCRASSSCPLWRRCAAYSVCSVELLYVQAGVWKSCVARNVGVRLLGRVSGLWGQGTLHICTAYAQAKKCRGHSSFCSIRNSRLAALTPPYSCRICCARCVEDSHFNDVACTTHFHSSLHPCLFDAFSSIPGTFVRKSKHGVSPFFRRIHARFSFRFSPSPLLSVDRPCGVRSRIAAVAGETW